MDTFVKLYKLYQTLCAQFVLFCVLKYYVQPILLTGKPLI